MSTSDDIYVVGIGASAGGLEAIEAFVDNLPNDSNMAYVIIQHLSSEYKSFMGDILSKRTSLKVFTGADGMKVEPNCIYLIPSKKNMTILNRKLFLSESSKKNPLNFPIDIFFESLAEDVGEKAIGVILSGTGSDGSRGVRAIKERNGMVIVQEEKSAKFDGMPKNAILTGATDYVSIPREIPEKLLNYIKHPVIANKQEGAGLLFTNDETLNRILLLLRDYHDLDFSFYKKSTIIRRLEKRLSINQIESLEEYYLYLRSSPKELSILFNDLLIGVTKFFRDIDGFQLIETIIPEIIKYKKEGECIRVWTAACSTGEEAYSLAILLHEYLQRNKLSYEVKIFATDINKKSIDLASAGVYNKSIVADVAPEYLDKYFILKDDQYTINPVIREKVIFASHNIIKNPPFNKIDILSCRNLLIYLQPVLQKKVLSFFHFSLNTGGYLFLGNSESIGEMRDYFEVVNEKWKIYKAKDKAKKVLSPNISIKRLLADKPRLKESSKKDVQHTTLEDGINKFLIEQFVPLTVTVDLQFNIVHYKGDLNKYLRLPSGELSFNILKMSTKEVTLTFSIGINKALKKNEKIVYKDVTFKRGGQTDDENQNKIIKLDLIFTPYLDETSKKQYVIIHFVEKEHVADVNNKYESQQINDQADERINHLEEELRFTKESLQATIEELETSNEELQATNEELISSNEELQSTNEELQSVNEELYTVNSEYQVKINELTVLNSDMDNLLRDTDIGTLFLDNNLAIRKFTPNITRLFNVMDVDIGRPISHITYNTDYDEIKQDIDEVINHLVAKEIQVKDNNNNWFLMKILPYRRSDNSIDGVIITIIDITEYKKTSTALQESEKRYHLLADAAFEGIVLSNKKHIIYANRAFAKMFGYEEVEIQQFRFADFIDEKDYPKIKDIAPDSDEVYKLTGIRKDKSAFPVEVRCKTMVYAGEILRIKAIRDASNNVLLKKLSKNKSKIDILLVEDNYADAKVTKSALNESRIKHNLTIIDDGEKALEFLKQAKEDTSQLPDLILLDIKLPKISGQEIMKYMHETPQLKQIPVIVMTFTSNREIINEAMDMEVKAYIEKPFTNEQFFKALNMIDDLWFVVKRN